MCLQNCAIIEIIKTHSKTCFPSPVVGKLAASFPPLVEIPQDPLSLHLLADVPMENLITMKIA